MTAPVGMETVVIGQGAAERSNRIELGSNLVPPWAEEKRETPVMSADSIGPRVLLDRIDHIISHQTPVFFAERDGFGDHSRTPIFLVGPAGPTAKRIRAILCAHSRVQGSRPLALMSRMATALEAWDKSIGQNRPFPDSLNGLSAEDSVKAATWLLAQIQQEEPGAEFVLDGQSMDAGLVGFAHLLFPNALMVVASEDDETAPKGLGEEAERLWDGQAR
ncbi:MAG: hypothetical protein ACPGYL_14685, partial [Rhodospirillaceae bacterium]